MPMHVCPHCGKSFIGDGASVLDEMTQGIFDATGGPKAIGKRMGEDYMDEEATAGQRVQRAWSMLGVIKTAEKARREDLRLEALTPEQQDAYLMEAAFRKLKGDPDWNKRFWNGADRRGLIPEERRLSLPDPNVVDAEFEKVGA